MTPPLAPTRLWDGGSTLVIPPRDYWMRLEKATALPSDLIREARDRLDVRVNEIQADDLSPRTEEAAAVLDQVTADGWFARQSRLRCPSCKKGIDAEQAADLVCPHCDAAYGEHGGVESYTVYVRKLARVRDVDSVVAIHGMNTSGAWQESFSWHLSTTWGRSVPVAVYKYGIVIAGVIMAWRRRTLQANLRAKLAALQDEARAQGFEGKPDVIAHSFGTWLFGHMLREELKRSEDQRLTFGRLILTGCILPPDFDWKPLKNAGLVDDVLNHYGTRDCVVPWAHFTIIDSGPSGRRGFDGTEAINIRAEGFGHSDLFSIERDATKPAGLTPLTTARTHRNQLEQSYHRYWRPFLTLPQSELETLPDRKDPAAAWQPLPWPLRGTLFPWLALPLVASGLLLAFLTLAHAASPATAIGQAVAVWSGLALGGLVGATVLTRLGRAANGWLKSGGDPKARRPRERSL